tara:strand:- start:119 stop:619 length:501 start_codon:yes stop_codon:yes gene_type:complete
MEAIKSKLFEAAKSKENLKSFEAWIYANKELSERLDDKLILSLYDFNYNQPSAVLEFRDFIFNYLDEQVFNFYYAKDLLVDISVNFYKADNILSDLGRMCSMNDCYGQIRSFSTYDDCVCYEGFFDARSEYRKIIKKEANEIIAAMEKFELENEFPSLIKFEEIIN